MPRRPRLELPGCAIHLTQRGVNRCAVFLDDEDVWRKVCKLKGRLIFGFGLFDLLLVLYYSPNGLGIDYMMLLMATMAITFIIAYFYAKNQYFKKYDN